MVKLTSKREQLIKDWLGKHEIADYDIKAYFDSSLDLKANMRNIAEQTGIIEPKTMQDALLDAERTKIVVENEIREQELAKIESIQKETDNLDKFYVKLKDMIEVVQKSENIHGMICLGDAGIGKSHSIQKNIGSNYVLLSGHITPIQFYLELMRNPNSTIIVDDATDIFRNPDTYGLLLQSLNTDRTRIIHWHSTLLERQDISMFCEFKGKIIIINNEMPDGLDTLLSRCYLRHIKFSLSERIEMMYAFANKMKIPTEIVDFIKDNYLVESSLNFRLVMKINEFFRTKKDKWQSMALDEMGTDENVILIKELDKEFLTTKDKEKAWAERTGKCRASFYNLRKKMRV